jgi:hypothetical protein
VCCRKPPPDAGKWSGGTPGREHHPPAENPSILTHEKSGPYAGWLLPALQTSDVVPALWCWLSCRLPPRGREREWEDPSGRKGRPAAGKPRLQNGGIAELGARKSSLGPAALAHTTPKERGSIRFGAGSSFAIPIHSPWPEEAQIPMMVVPMLLAMTLKVERSPLLRDARPDPPSRSTAAPAPAGDRGSRLHTERKESSGRAA